MKTIDLDEMAAIDKIARKNLSVAGYHDPRIGMKGVDLSQYEAIRRYDAALSTEFVKLLNKDSSCSEKPDNSKRYEPKNTRNPYVD